MPSAAAAAWVPPVLFRGLRGLSSADVPREVLAVCGITLADGLLVGRSYAERRGYPIDANQEMLAFAACNVAAGFTGSIPTGSSGSRTAAMDGAGSRSQLPSLVGAVVVALVLVFLSGLLALLPNAALGGIVANAVLALIDVDGLRELYRLRRSEFGVAAVCLASVLLLGTVAAVLIAFVLSVIDVVRRASTPSTGVLGELPGHRGFLVVDDPSKVEATPGVVVFRFGAQLFFANADTFRQQVGDPPGRVDDAEAALVRARRRGHLRHRHHRRRHAPPRPRLLHEQQVTFALTRVAEPVGQLLARYELLEPVGQEHVFETNRDALDAFERTAVAR